VGVLGGGGLGDERSAGLWVVGAVVLIVGGPKNKVIVGGPGQFLSSELSLQSLSPSHLKEDGIHFLRLAHLNSDEEHRTKGMVEVGVVVVILGTG